MMVEVAAEMDPWVDDPHEDREWKKGTREVGPCLCWPEWWFPWHVVPYRPRIDFTHSEKSLAKY